MKRLASAMGLLVAMSSVISVAALPPKPSFASWVSSNCYSSHTNILHYRRKDAQAYAAVARSEGYEWGGGCWNNN